MENALGMEPPTLFTDMLAFIQARRDAHWSEHVRTLDYELFDQAVGAYNWDCLDSLRKEAKEQGWWKAGVTGAAEEDEMMKKLRAELDGPFARRLLLWRKTKEDLLDEMGSVVQMPGWANIWTQPIINRIDMLATGVRTEIGVKVFGDDLEKIKAVSEEVAAVLRPIHGAVDLTPDQDFGKGYLEIDVDRRRAARYGVNVGDIQDVIETALGGKAITTTVEGRERYPVRIRYARRWREDEEAVKNLLVSAGGGRMDGDSAAVGRDDPAAKSRQRRAAGPGVPLSMVADVRIVEGPAMLEERKRHALLEGAS